MKYTRNGTFVVKSENVTMKMTADTVKLSRKSLAPKGMILLLNWKPRMMFRKQKTY